MTHEEAQRTNGYQRRQLGRAALAAVAALGLAACGGGGGDGNSENLREAYDKINHGMTKEQVLAILGREPDNKGNTSWFFRNPSRSETLHIGFGTDPGEDILEVGYVNWYTVGNPGQDISK